MELFFYNVFLLSFKLGVRIAALFNTKAKKWLDGRKGIWQNLELSVGNQPSKIVWVHCASLGEFEQGRPVIEAIKSKYPNVKILLTFFSPSGYEIRKNYAGADSVFYLPMDGADNAKRFFETVKPSLVIFVKYEFWYHYLKEIKNNKVPLLLISALFRKNSVFFKWYGGLQRQMLSFFDHLFVQDNTSKDLLATIGFSTVSSVAGDNRFDRVVEIAAQFKPVSIIEQFTAGFKTIVAGSTWLEDELLLEKAMATISDSSLKLIIAPHEINEQHIAQIQKLFPGSVLFSQLQDRSQHPFTCNVLIIDNIGMLSQLYNYASITYVGGGFGKGIHNTLEAAVYGKPVLFGPTYHKFREAIDLVNTGGAISITNPEQCVSVIQTLLQDDSAYMNYCKKSKEYVLSNRGATEKILAWIQEKRLLTN